MISRQKKTSQENENQNRDRWMISYADLLTLLLGLFIVMYAASDKNRAKLVVESFSGQNQGGNGILPNQDSKDDDDKFQKSLMENPVLMKKIKIRKIERGFVVSLNETGFFAPGDIKINQQAKKAIEVLAKSLKNSKAKIRVEGHTDSLPISNARYPSNWELSTARASAVLIKFVELGISPERLSAAGYGGFQPVASNETYEGRMQNRRVDVVVLNR